MKTHKQRSSYTISSCSQISHGRQVDRLY